MHHADLEPILAAAVCLLLLRSLTYLRVFRLTGALVALILQVILDMLPLVVILCVGMLAFGIAFMYLGSFETTGDSLFDTFLIMLGEFRFEHLGTGPEVQTLFVLYASFSMVIMLNVSTVSREAG